MKLADSLIMLFLVVLLGGCAGSRSLVPGQSTEADVQAAMGKPRDTRTDANGDLIWEYPTGPEGFANYAVRLGPDKRVKSVTQLVTEEQLEKVIVGKSSKTEVRQLLGRPAEETVYQVGPTWYWRFMRNGISPGYLVVTFDQSGMATSKIAIIDMPGDKLD
jgi:SmpA/OmlA family protein